MAKLPGITSERIEEFNNWILSRPEIIQKTVKEFPPDVLYKLKPDNLRVMIVGYNEDGTLVVLVSGRFNKIPYEHQITGITTDNLEECDLPVEGEELGTMFTDKAEIDKYILDQANVQKEKEAKMTFKCSKCGSEDIRRDASVAWSKEKQTWEIVTIYDKDIECNNCDAKNSDIVIIKI